MTKVATTWYLHHTLPPGTSSGTRHPPDLWARQVSEEVALASQESANMKHYKEGSGVTYSLMDYRRQPRRSQINTDHVDGIPTRPLLSWSLPPTSCPDPPAVTSSWAADLPSPAAGLPSPAAVLTQQVKSGLKSAPAFLWLSQGGVLRCGPSFPAVRDPTDGANVRFFISSDDNNFSS